MTSCKSTIAKTHVGTRNKPVYILFAIDEDLLTCLATRTKFAFERLLLMSRFLIGTPTKKSG